MWMLKALDSGKLSYMTFVNYKLASVDCNDYYLIWAHAKKSTL